MNDIIIKVEHLKNVLDGKVIHEDVSFEVRRGEIIAVIGGSGCGKTTLLRSILRLITPTAGLVEAFGINLATASPEQFLSIQKRWSMMFQGGALFSSLTVLENVLYVLKEYAGVSEALQVELAKLKVVLSGLEIEAADKYPSELSGGMKKRAALARAIALDPDLIFLDEPTAGLDPKSASGLDQLILEMRKNLGLTFIMVTHDVDTLALVPDRIIFLGEQRVLADCSWKALLDNPHPLIHSYLSEDRIRR